MRAQQIEGPVQLVGAGAADGIIKGHDETGARCGNKSGLNDGPGLEVVGERDRTEIMPERCAGPCRNGQHGGDARYDAEFDGAPLWRPGFHGLANGGGHGKDAGVTA